jgi:hypothetical protein
MGSRCSTRGEVRNAKTVERRRVLVSPQRRGENIKTDVIEICCEDAGWIKLTWDRDQ